MNFHNDKWIMAGELMTQKVEMFSCEHQFELQRKINDFAKTHHIESISYSTCQIGYSAWHHACVLYT